MKQYLFTANELYCIAYISGKTKVYGIAYDIGSDIEASIHKITDTLVTKDVLTINVDGGILVADDYRDIVNFVSDCQNCITINAQKKNGESQSIIIWKYNDQYLMAEFNTDYYLMVSIDEYIVKSILQSFLPTNQCEVHADDVIIPLKELTKVKRLGNSKASADIDLMLKQNGVADDKISKLIADGLLERADYIGILHMDMNVGECQKEEAAYLSDGNVILEINRTIVNFRTSLCFSCKTAMQVGATIESMVDAFINGQPEGVTL